MHLASPLSRLAPVLVAAASLLACAPASEETPSELTPSPPPPGDGPKPSTQLSVNWSSCTLDTVSKEPAECATIKVPYRWDAPDDARTVDVFVKHYRRKKVGTSQGQVWMLQGGPGAWGADMDGLGEYLAYLGVDMDYYSIDQRGTGRSSRLGCKVQESEGSDLAAAIAPDEWPPCIDAMKAQWGPGLEGFSVTNTARDLGALVDRLRAPDQPVFVFGVSYGTYLANRYMQLYPAQATGVILDSIVAPRMMFTHSDDAFDAAVHDLFDACGTVDSCSKRLGPDPWAMFGDLLTRMEGGHCPSAAAAGIDRTALRHLFASFAYEWDKRILIPALIHRLDRCGAQDQPVIERIGSLLSQPETEEDAQAFSMALSMHIGLSEMWDEPSPPVASLVEAEKRLLVCNGIGANMGAVHDIWPRLPHDEHWGAWAETETPVLMLAGTLDPATPYGEQLPAKDAFQRPHQTFVTLPRAPHGVVANSPVTTPGAPTCGSSLLAQFLKDPTATLDTSCTETMQPLAFDQAASSADYFGTNDLWGD